MGYHTHGHRQYRELSGFPRDGEGERRVGQRSLIPLTWGLDCALLDMFSCSRARARNEYHDNERFFFFFERAKKRSRISPCFCATLGPTYDRGLE